MDRDGAHGNEEGGAGAGLASPAGRTARPAHRPARPAVAHHDLAKAINYMLRRWGAFTRFLDDGRVCLTNNAAERALRCVPLGRKALGCSAAPIAAASGLLSFTR